jgi:hypothetical protein
MGLLGSIQKLALTPSAYIGKQVLKVVKPSSSIANQPVSTTTSQLQATTFGKVLGTAIAGTTTALAVTSIGAGAIAKTVVAHPVKSAVVGLVTPTAISYFAEKPQDFVKIPTEAISFTSDIGTLASNPSVSGVVKLITEHKTASAVTAVVAGVVVGKSVIPAIASYKQTQAIQEQTEAIKGASAGIGATPQEKGGSDGNIPITQTNPTTPQTVYMDEKPKTAKKKTRSKARRGNISQRVNIVVTQKQSAHRITQSYLNRIPVYN